MSFIEIKNLVKRYKGNTAVDNVSFHIEKGELFGLLGPNGAGKSTTISMLSGILQPSAGNIYINGNDVVEKNIIVKKILGLVPQDIALYPTLSAKENLMFWGKMYGVPKMALKNRVSEVLQIVGLEERKNEMIKNYSGGMKRRINIGAALLHNPEILIMDEPTVGIDPQSRNHILETVKKLNQEGMTVIYTSHYMEEVEYLCNQIGIMDKGKLIAFGNKDDIKKTVINKEKIEIKLSQITPVIGETIKEFPSVEELIIKDRDITIYSKGNGELLEDIISITNKAEIKILSINIEEPNLESVFIHLTGKALRD
ncbi:ABC transporter ATP-binding protein [Clostridium sp. UBA6640]|uniref:ABC transporter ATP-binding protein n=1 Tax=Clostridium sp. UBA6640 TaxID=1946370 RepID=UPI0025C3B15A|nr:ABC transporter ATP-binding protein [Clostridium sp. UBA6640]